MKQIISFISAYSKYKIDKELLKTETKVASE